MNEIFAHVSLLVCSKIHISRSSVLDSMYFHKLIRACKNLLSFLDIAYQSLSFEDNS